jgi:cytochrome c oxidase cbb3-type subunit 4
MYQTLAQFAATWWTLYFVVLFVVVLVYALRPKNRRMFDDAAAMPLRED